MKVLYKTGPKAGTTAHVPRSQEIEVLLNAGLIEEILPPPPEPAKVTWTINVGQVTQRIFITGRCSRSNCGVLRYEGPAASSASVKFQHCCGADAKPTPIPTEIIERYARAKGEEQAVITKDEGVFWNLVHNKAGDNTHREVDHGNMKAQPRKLAYEE